MKNNLETLIGYENKIVDLTRRNRLLHYPKTGKQINFDLTLKEFIKHFGNLDDLNIEFPHKEILNELSEENNEIPEKNKKGPFIPPTDQQGEDLIDLLNSLRLETQRKFEEHGIHTLFLAIGHVKWKEPCTGTKNSSNIVNEYDFDAPLLLVPITITEKKKPKQTVITTHLEICDITVNTVLKLILEKEYNARPLTATGLAKDGNGEQPTEHNWLESYQALVNETTTIFSEFTEKVEFEITNNIKIAQYSFQGQQIYEDLHANQEAILKNDFINALATHTQLRQSNLEISSENNPDILLTATDDFNVMDADSSQLAVIHKAINGNHLNIQGPPGTGKSQTIVNLISNFLAREKKVLLVCEKQVALEVVLERLKRTGLDKLCLPLFRINADKKTFAKSVIEDRDKIIRQSTEYNESALKCTFTKRSNRINTLREYAKEISNTVMPLEKNVFWVHGELAKHSVAHTSKPIQWKGVDPLEVTLEDYNKIMDLLQKNQTIFNTNHDKTLSHWKTVNKSSTRTPAFTNQLKNSLSQLKEHLIKMSETNLTFVKLDSFAALQKVYQLQTLVKTIQPIDTKFIIDVDLKNLIKEIADILEHITKYNTLQKSYTNKYEIPLTWNINYPTLSNCILSDTITIRQIKAAINDAPIIKEHIKAIEKVHRIIYELVPVELDELLAYRYLLQTDPTLQIFKNWTNTSSLRQLYEQLKELQKLHTRLLKAKNTCEKWDIAVNDIEPEEIAPLCERFENNYTTIFRYFSGKYYRDRNRLIRLCDTEKKPLTFNQYADIAHGIKDHIKLSGSFQTSFEKFKHDNLQLNTLFDATQITPIINEVKKVLDWLELAGKIKLPEQLIQLMQLHGQYDNINDLIHANNGINSTIGGSWSVFGIKPTTDIKDIINAFPTIQQNLDYIEQLFEKTKCIHKQVTNDCTIKSLKSCILEIDALAKTLEHIKSVECLLRDKNLLIQMINEPAILEALQKNLINLKKLTDEGLQASIIPVSQAIDYLNELQKTFPQIHSWLEEYTQIITTINDLFENKQSMSHAESLNFQEYIGMLDLMFKDLLGLETWIRYRLFEEKIEKLGLTWFIQATKNKPIDNSAALFAQSFWSAWLEAHYKKTPTLQTFAVSEHEQIIKEFKYLDEKTMAANAARVCAVYAPKFKIIKKLATENDKQLVHQSELKMRHKPIRKLVKELGKQLLTYKPCWMMNPLTLSSYIPYGSIDFDVVIFDEASQMRVEHALGSIARAKQVIILGDEKQLPPTEFFEILKDSEPENNDDMVEDYESILKATKEVLPGADCLLAHHYRSKFEDLIAFSNHYIYGDQLVTFPNPQKDVRAVQFEYVEEGVFDGGAGGSRRNHIEAERVAKLCIEHVTTWPDKSLGVIALSKSQEDCIRQAVKSVLKQQSHLQDLLNETSDKFAPFFIKNLESVQGDERDVIILSIGYGRDKQTGNVYNRFGPINSTNGYRRLNVAVTRAKEKVICVSSIHASDIRNTEKQGSHLLQKYIEYAERGRVSLDASLLVQDQDDTITDSPFEESVKEALKTRGYKVRSQVGASGFKIDLAIINPKNEQEYILGVECDGAAYHSNYSARMNDRIRQKTLEKLGWTIYRIWSQHWILHKEEILDEIEHMIHESVDKHD